MENGFNPMKLWTEPLGSLSGRLSRWFPEFAESLPDRALHAPAVDVAEDAEAYRVSAELPGFSEKEVDVTFEDGILAIRGSRTEETERKELRYHHVERRSGSFERAFRLPGAIDETRVTASMKDGILSVTLPKREEAKPRSIQVRKE